MDDSLDASTRANAHALIVAKRDYIVAERSSVLEQRSALLARLRRLDRELSDCRAAARLFDLNIEFPPDERDEERLMLLRRHEAEQRNDSAHRDALILRQHQVRLAEYSSRKTAPPPSLSASNIPPAAAPFSVGYEPSAERLAGSVNAAARPKAPRPVLKDVVLERLRIAGAKGERAAPIREYIERAYGESIHEKTVGMTLYRLQSSKLVRREGQTWFLASPLAERETPVLRAPGADS